MITSRQNRRLKDIRRLRRSKGSKGPSLLLEGPHLVAAAIAEGLPLVDVLASAEFVRREDAQALLARLPLPPKVVAAELLDELADADTPRGIVALAEHRWHRVEEIPQREDGIYLYVGAVQDPGNLGALARVAEATGVTAIVLAPGSVRPSHPRALRGSAGSLLSCVVAPGVEIDTLQRRLSPLAPRWVALVPAAREELYDARLEGALVLMIGAEGSGLDPPSLACADLRLRVPMAASVESLNVAVAAAVVLFEIRRQRQQR